MFAMEGIIRQSGRAGVLEGHTVVEGGKSRWRNRDKHTVQLVDQETILGRNVPRDIL